MAKKPGRKDQNAGEKQKESAGELNDEQLEEISGGALGLTGIGGDAEVRRIREKELGYASTKRGRKRVRK